MSTFIIKTFGCKTNQYESEGIRESLAGAGWTEVESTNEAAVAIINTCTVTSRAGASARNSIRKMLKINPAIRILITGCAVDVHEEWLEDLGAEASFKNVEKHQIIEYLMNNEMPKIKTINDGFDFSITEFAGHTRAFLKIQDGCDNFCSYCIIPYARGLPRSRDVGDILREADCLSENGYSEIVLTGINIGAYNFHDFILADLVANIAMLPKVERIRLGSIEPVYITDNLLHIIAETDKICNHIHLPLQSGSNTVLKNMNRNYTKEFFLERVFKAREILDNPAITTDIIVGFPSEDDKNFEETLSTIRGVGFARSHIFLFSPRPGTPAATMKRPPEREADARRLILEDLAESQARTYSKKLIGIKGERIMVEKVENDTACGYLDRYIRAKVNMPKGSKILKRGAYPVRIEGLKEDVQPNNGTIENTLLCTLTSETDSTEV